MKLSQLTLTLPRLLVLFSLLLIVLSGCQKESIEENTVDVVQPIVVEGRMKFSSEENLGKYLTEMGRLKPQEIAHKNYGIGFKSLNQKISDLRIEQVAIAKSITTNGYSANTHDAEIKEQFSRLPFVPSPLFASILNEKGEFSVGNRLVKVTNEYTFNFLAEDSSRVSALDKKLLEDLSKQNQGRFFNIPGTSVYAYKIVWQKGPEKSRESLTKNSYGDVPNANAWEEWNNVNAYVAYAYTSKSRFYSNGSIAYVNGYEQTRGALYNFNNGYFSTIIIQVGNWGHWTCYSIWFFVHEGWDRSYADYAGARWESVVNYPTRTAPNQWVYNYTPFNDRFMDYNVGTGETQRDICWQYGSMEDPAWHMLLVGFYGQVYSGNGNGWLQESNTCVDQVAGPCINVTRPN